MDDLDHFKTIPMGRRFPQLASDVGLNPQGHPPEPFPPPAFSGLIPPTDESAPKTIPMGKRGSPESTIFFKPEEFKPSEGRHTFEWKIKASEKASDEANRETATMSAEEIDRVVRATLALQSPNLAITGAGQEKASSQAVSLDELISILRHHRRSQQIDFALLALVEAVLFLLAFLLLK